MLTKDTKVKIIMHWEDEDGVKRPVAELDNIDLETVDKVLNELEYVRVVRCKDCKHRTDEIFGYCDVLEQHIYRGDKFFCGCGERRENEDI